MSACVIGLAMAILAAGDAPLVLSWGPMLDSVREEPDLESLRARLVEKARDAAKEPIVRRARSYAEVGQNRTWLDGRAEALEDEIRETFALAMSDHGACGTLSQELPLLAAAYRLTDDPMFLERTAAQLEEMADWRPLQRPGWTLYHPGARLPEDGKDGNWLATGCGVRAIADTIEILPENALNPEIVGRLHALLEGEIAGVVDDWHSKRPWFVRSNDAITNQWVLPTEGLVRGCLLIGRASHAEQYELGVANLMQALDAHGPRGEFEEGIGYASFTVTSIVNTARAMAVAGDRRAIDHPFLANFPLWLVHHIQPGDYLINCFDAGAARGASVRLRPLLSLLAVCTGSPVARWALEYQCSGEPDSLVEVAARGLAPVPANPAPPLFAEYKRAARVNWRDSWQPSGSGVWVRGGHPTDQHDHHDRGHVNFIAHGTPLLIEAGTPYYHHPLMGSHFASGAGHNVLQLGLAEPQSVQAGDTLVAAGWQERGVVAPIAVRRLDSNGGDVALEITSGYPGLKRWTREALWDADRIEIRDMVELQADRTDVVLFHWHTGGDDPLTLVGDQEAWRAEWPSAAMIFEAGAPIVVEQTPWPDNTVNTLAEDAENDPRHVCAIVRTRDPVNACEIRTTVVWREGHSSGNEDLPCASREVSF